MGLVYVLNNGKSCPSLQNASTLSVNVICILDLLFYFPFQRQLQTKLQKSMEKNSLLQKELMKSREPNGIIVSDASLAEEGRHN